MTLRAIRFCSFLAAVTFLASIASAKELVFPQREGTRPETTNGVPHIQIGIDVNEELAKQLLEHVSEFPGVTLGPTRVSLPGAIGFQLERNRRLSNPGSIVGGLEFAHMHPDGSLHAALDPKIAKQAVEAGWAIAHPWANQRPGWGGFVMIYTPTNPDELKVVIALIESSYTFITGTSLN